jgi:hypothetical protein
MATIFISYQHEDEGLARVLELRLGLKGTFSRSRFPTS